MSVDSKRRIVGGGALSTLGALLATVTLFDVYEDFALQGDPLVLTLVENSLPLVLNLGLVAAGLLLVSDDSVPEEFVTRSTAWSVLGAVSLFGITGWVYYFQVAQGQIKPHILFSHVVSMGAVAGLAVGFYDGQRREREEQVVTERDKMMALFENSSDCIAEIEFVDDRPLVRDVNPAFCETFGLDLDAVRGRCIDDVIVPSEDEGMAGVISERANRGDQFEIDGLTRRTAGGEVRVFRLQAIPLDATSWAADGYAVYTDVTAEHRYEERMTSLHEATRELMTIGSIEGVARTAVDAAEAILKLDFTSIHQYDSEREALCPVAHTERMDDLIGAPPTIRAGEAIAWEVFESGTPRYVGDLSAERGAYNDDSTLASELIVPLNGFGVLLIGAQSPHAFDESDFSLAKILAANVEAAMERAEREARLQQQNERLETFTSIVSHDLRNPLSVADGYLELAREGDEAALVRVEDALDRMEELIANLLELAREGASVDAVRSVDLAAVAHGAWTSTATADATLQIDTAAEIEADPDRLQQLFENLFTNAVEHGGDDVTVRVTSADSGFAVEDDGPGIPEEDREDVLAHGYTTDADGTGFGLAIVNEIAGGHGWQMTVESGRSGGAKFVFETE
ncbi:PAS domain-containing sensor histidine kinase [Halobellus rarus]|uniref:histidine kinase n=1 Tax=Halobellus rarus TaxID=1126237 RepID=A0ABD6CK63_9EURY|nr:ATP-binding protein [Halobellus rarus]